MLRVRFIIARRAGVVYDPTVTRNNSNATLAKHHPTMLAIARIGPFCACKRKLKDHNMGTLYCSARIVRRAHPPAILNRRRIKNEGLTTSDNARILNLTLTLSFARSRCARPGGSPGKLHQTMSVMARALAHIILTKCAPMICSPRPLSVLVYVRAKINFKYVQRARIREIPKFFWQISKFGHYLWNTL